MTALKCFIIIGQNSDLFQEKIENKIIPQSKESQRMNLPTANSAFTFISGFKSATNEMILNFEQVKQNNGLDESLILC